MKSFPDNLLEFDYAAFWLNMVKDAHIRNIYPYQPPFSNKRGNDVDMNGRQYLLVSSYDYLSLLGHHAINEAAIEAINKYGTGSSGVRLLTGTLDVHLLLEKALVLFSGKEAAITFSSGYAANLSLLSSLLTRDDHVFADHYIHRSLVEGLQLSGCKLCYYHHNDTDHLETLLAKQDKRQRTFIISEGVFSMEGDICCLPELTQLRDRYHAFLIIDEAHSLGMLGTGVCNYYGIDPSAIDIITGSLSKAVPAQGGFVAGSKKLITYLQHAAATYIFSSALNPPSIMGALKALELILEEPQRGRMALSRANLLRQKFHEAGFSTGHSSSAIIPVILGRQESCLRITADLRRNGILASPVVFPAVPRNKTRLRICTSANFEIAEMDRLVNALQKACSKQTFYPNGKMEGNGWPGIS